MRRPSAGGHGQQQSAGDFVQCVSAARPANRRAAEHTPRSNGCYFVGFSFLHHCKPPRLLFFLKSARPAALALLLPFLVSHTFRLPVLCTLCVFPLFYNLSARFCLTIHYNWRYLFEHDGVHTHIHRILVLLRPARLQRLQRLHRRRPRRQARGHHVRPA